MLCPVDWLTVSDSSTATIKASPPQEEKPGLKAANFMLKYSSYPECQKECANSEANVILYFFLAFHVCADDRLIHCKS